jgi:lysozyme
MQVFPMVVDLSHWDPAQSYSQVKASGIHGVIYKATEGSNYQDTTYVSQQHAAKAAGLCWGAYHFADASSVNKQIDNFMHFADPDPDELFCLDWEDNGGNAMSLANAQTWITEVEKQLGREGQCVIYSGNTAKEALGNSSNAFFGSRRLWLCQYTTGTPTWAKAWDNYWLWQFTDGQSGSTPHSVSGIGHCDINSFDRDGGSDELIATWATGKSDGPGPTPPPAPSDQVVSVVISAPPGITVKVRQTQLTAETTARIKPARKIEGKG